MTAFKADNTPPYDSDDEDSLSDVSATTIKIEPATIQTGAGPGPATARARAKAAGTTGKKSLGKGRACLKCRSRKMRCDGKHPTCSSCLKANRPCIYEEEKSRTRKLLDRIEVLEEKLSSLQATSATSDRHSTRTRKSNGKTVAASNPATPKMPSSKVPACLISEDALHLDGVRVADIDFSGEWWWSDHPPPPIQRYLLDLCICQRARPGLHLHIGRFYDSVYSPSPQRRPLPGLLNVMYLVGCHFSNDPLLTRLEPIYLERSRRTLANELGKPNLPLVQWMQASCLLTYYLTRLGRYLEARYELSGAAQLIVACGLHKITSSTWSSTPSPPTTTDDARSSLTPAQARAPDRDTAMAMKKPVLGPPRDHIELAERIGLFWMAYSLDHVNSLVCGLPPNMHFEREVETVWPRLFDEYEKDLPRFPDGDIASLIRVDPAPAFDPPCSMYALRVKAMALLATATSFAINVLPDNIYEIQNIITFEQYRSAINAFRHGIPPITYDPSTNEIEFVPQPPVNISLFLIHTIALTALVQLCGAFGHNLGSKGTPECTGLYNERLDCAKIAVELLRTVLAAGIPLKTFPTTCGFAWCAIARVLAQHLIRLRKRPASENTPAVREDMGKGIDTLVSAISTMSAPFPILGYQLDRLKAYFEEQQIHTATTAFSSRPSSTPAAQWIGV